MADESQSEEPRKLVRVRGRPRKNGPTPEIVTPFDELPHEVEDPRRRSVPTIGLVELTPDGHAARGTKPPPLDVPDAIADPIRDHSDDVLRTFDDLMAAFPIGDIDGQYYIHVERKQPTQYMNYATRGILRRVRERITLELFKQEYGGGVYDLIVYGPPRHGGMPDPVTGRPVPKALTKPVRIVIPWHQQGGIAPNPDAAYDQEAQDEVGMSSNGDDRVAGLPGRIFRNGPTPAAAQIVNSQLAHDREMADRREARRARHHQERQSHESNALTLLERQAEARAAALQDQLTEAQREMRELRTRNGSPVDDAVKIMDRMQPRAPASELAELRDQQRREIESITRAHKTELETLQRMNREDHDRMTQQMQAATDRAEDRVRDIQRRADERVTQVEQMMDRERKQAKTDMERQEERQRADNDRAVAHATAEHQRAMEAQRSQYETILASERRQSERDVQTQGQIAESKRVTDTKTLEVDLKAKERELSALRRELEEAKHQVERAKNLTELLDAARKQAEALGYIHASEAEPSEKEESTWMDVVKTIFMKGAEHFPEIIKGASEAVAMARGQTPGTSPAQQPQQQRQAMAGMPAPRNLYPMPQGQAYFAPPGAAPPAEGPPIYPQRSGGMPVPVPPMAAAAPAVPMAVGAIPPDAMAVAGAAPMAPAPAPAEPSSFPPLTQNVAPGPAPAAAAPPPANEPQALTPEEVQAFDAQIMQNVPDLERAFGAEQDPVELAKLLILNYGKDVVRERVASLGPDNILSAIQRSGAQSRLLTRAGKKFLRALHQSVLQGVS